MGVDQGQNLGAEFGCLFQKAGEVAKDKGCVLVVKLGAEFGYGLAGGVVVIVHIKSEFGGGFYCVKGFFRWRG